MNTAQKRVLTNQNLSILLTILARFVSYAGRFNPSNIFGFPVFSNPASLS